MDSELRHLFNKAFTTGIYDSYRQTLARRLDTRFEFRLAETPVFLPADLRFRCVRAAQEIMDQLCEPARIKQMKRAIPTQWHAPSMDALPSFTQIDFAIAGNSDGTLAPRLIELQGFPSLTAFTVIQRDVWAETLSCMRGLNKNWSCWFSELDRERFIELARRTIVGSNNPEEVILMDLDPPSQKTLPDFIATKKLLDVDAVCPTTLIRKGNQLWRRLPNPPDRLVQVKRIHNRVVFDELIQKRLELPFRFKDELDVEWSPHPNWYWVWSKYSLPFIDHPAAPRTLLVSELRSIPEDISRRYVLKPLFSFAGGGVNVEPTAEDLDRIPDRDRSSWCLQERIQYEPALKAPGGAAVKVEIRMMFLKPDDEPTPILAQNLCRLSRGKMMGVDFNKNLDWVGASVALWPQ